MRIAGLFTTLQDRRRLAMSVAATGLAVLLLVALLRAGNGGGTTGPTVTVDRRAFAATVVAIGAVKPQIGAEVRVGSRISGRVRRLRANIGDRVGKGQVIAELETEELDALIAQRRAELQLADAKLATLEALSPEETARAEADVARFEATAKLASDEWERQQALRRGQIATQAEAEAARERHLVAHAQLDAARRALELVKSGSTQQRKQAEAEQARAAASLQSALVDRSFTVIASPIAGIVASVSTQEGETVAAGLSAPTFVTIVDLERLQVNAYVDEVDIGKVAVGQAALFTVDAFPQRDFEGHVAAIYPSATIQDNVVKYIVAVTIQGGYGGLLRPEMTASVHIQLEERMVLAIPARAVSRQGGESVVYLWRDGRPERRDVRLGWRDGPWVEVLEGLQEGDRILLDAPASTEAGNS